MWGSEPGFSWENFPQDLHSERQTVWVNLLVFCIEPVVEGTPLLLFMMIDGVEVEDSSFLRTRWTASSSLLVTVLEAGESWELFLPAMWLAAWLTLASSCMIVLLRMSRLSFSLLSSASCWTIVLLLRSLKIKTDIYHYLGGNISKSYLILTIFCKTPEKRV